MGVRLLLGTTRIARLLIRVKMLGVRQPGGETTGGMGDMLKMYKLWMALNRAMKREEGQSLVEYGLIIALIAVVVVGALFLMGGTISNLFTNITGNL